MKILVLGGCGIQGRTAVHDLAASPEVTEIICADADLSGLDRIRSFTDMEKVSPVAADCTQSDQLIPLFEKADAAIDMLPRQFTEAVCRAAMKTGVSVVNTNYGYDVRSYHEEAVAAGVAIMPECGLDPGIDLVLYGDALRRFDELTLINSYCGGLPEASAIDNPLKYKISWTWEGVLSSTMRRARFIRDGKVLEISPEDQHDNDSIHTVDFPGLGELEAVPNGDAVFFTDLLGVSQTIRETGRYSLRWPGWCAFWAPLKKFGMLDDRLVPGLPCEVTPYEFMVKLLEPQLQYRDDERDLVAMFNVFEGRKDGKRKRLSTYMLIERDLDTGMMAMSKGVGFPACIVAQMIVRGEISAKGVLSPAKDIPCEPFLRELNRRGIVIEEEEEWLA